MLMSGGIAASQVEQISSEVVSDLTGMGYSGEFVNPTGESLIQMTKFDVTDSDGALGYVTIYQNDEFMVYSTILS